MGGLFTLPPYLSTKLAVPIFLTMSQRPPTVIVNQQWPEHFIILQCSAVSSKLKFCSCIRSYRTCWVCSRNWNPVASNLKGLVVKKLNLGDLFSIDFSKNFAKHAILDEPPQCVTLAYLVYVTWNVFYSEGFRHFCYSPKRHLMYFLPSSTMLTIKFTSCHKTLLFCLHFWDEMRWLTFATLELRKIAKKRTPPMNVNNSSLFFEYTSALPPLPPSPPSRRPHGRNCRNQNWNRGTPEPPEQEEQDRSCENRVRGRCVQGPGAVFTVLA